MGPLGLAFGFSPGAGLKCGFIDELSHHLPAAAGFCKLGGRLREGSAASFRSVEGDPRRAFLARSRAFLTHVAAYSALLRIKPRKLSRAIVACYNLWLSRSPIFHFCS
jgi:hypothetical protein